MSANRLATFPSVTDRAIELQLVKIKSGSTVLNSSAASRTAVSLPGCKYTERGRGSADPGEGLVDHVSQLASRRSSARASRPDRPPVISSSPSNAGSLVSVGGVIDQRLRDPDTSRQPSAETSSIQLNSAPRCLCNGMLAAEANHKSLSVSAAIVPERSPVAHSSKASPSSITIVPLIARRMRAIRGSSRTRPPER